MLAWIQDHKKLTAAFIASLVQFAGTLWPQYVTQINWVSGIIVAYIMGQGFADIGKSAAQIQASSTTPPAPPAA